MSRIALSALLALTAAAAACSRGAPTPVAPPDAPSRDEGCRSGWSTSTGRCEPVDPTDPSFG